MSRTLYGIKQLVFSLRPSDDGEVYTVKPGDRLIPIARAHKTTFTFIRRASGLKTDAIRVGPFEGEELQGRRAKLFRPVDLRRKPHRRASNSCSQISTRWTTSR